MEKVLTVAGTILFLFGAVQGVSIGIAEEPFLDGIIGGIFPLIAGAVGTYALTWKG